jgi:CRISPR-associated endonuclease/helicase Cas3
MTDFHIDDFAPYFAAVHEAEPFPWQRRLLKRVVDRGWPDALDLPTGAGKTAVLDIALFHLALEAALPQRRAAVRTVLVVDRRTVVDQAFARATKIGKALTRGATPLLHVMRERLQLLAGAEEEPVAVALLRGGIARDVTWARNPVQPVLAVSTVDQVGSRLLFRGYGVSSSMRPVHAGLLGNDTLFVLDEVHLSEPFRQTIGAIASRYRSWAERPLPDRWRVVSMSATLPPRQRQNHHVESRETFSLTDVDRGHPILRRRLTARKATTLMEVRVSGDEDTRRRRFAESLATAAMPRPDIPGAAVAVVVNRVRTAHLVFEQLRRTHGDRVVTVLLTGRMRPIDRADVEARVLMRTGAGRSPRSPEDGKPTIVVTTQCIEAGADLDFDVLVTECASVDALRQRFGRLNRLGDAERCAGAVLARSDSLGDDDDPIYGAALKRTWALLKSRRGQQDEIDLGIEGFHVGAEELPGLIPELRPAPLLLPAHLDTWVQTSPVPEPDPDVALWLHGPDHNEPEVQIVWRADLDELAQGTEGVQRGDILESLLERLEVCPPQTAEALTVPMSAARRWLAGSAGDDTADVEGIPVGSEEEDRSGRPAIAWRGERSSIVTPDTKIAPGDTLVVPCRYGGLFHGNWAPESTDPVPDIGDRAAHESGRRQVLRLQEAVWGWTRGELVQAYPELPRPAEVEGEDHVQEDEKLDVWLREVAALDLPPWLATVVGGVIGRRRRRIVRLTAGPDESSLRPSGEYYALVARAGRDATTEDDASSFTGVSVNLRTHLVGVGSFARSFGERCGLPSEIVSALEIAGQWHDVGKVDPRFQVLLHGGSVFRATVAAEPLAKSAIPPGDRRARRQARERSRYPEGYRHELMSTALILQNPAGLKASGEVDLDLILYLVSSHHGWCRPLAPVAFDSDPVAVEFQSDTGRLLARSDHGLEALDSGISDRFFRLVRRYGWHGLAWLEAILRLADHRRSEWEQEQGAEA